MSHFSCLFSSDKNVLSPTSIPQKHSKTIPSSVLAAKSFRSRKKNLNPILCQTWKNSLFLLTHFILLPLESKPCPLRLASVLGCADSGDELRFWTKSESHFAQPLIYSMLLPLESKQCPLTLPSVLACAGSADEPRF